MANMDDLLLNARRRQALTDEIKNSVGVRILIMIAEFPFLVIGTIKEVEGDFISICADTTHITELEGRVLRLHIDAITVFYLESHGPCIPEIC